MDIYYHLEEDGSYTLQCMVIDQDGGTVDKIGLGKIESYPNPDGWVFVPNLEVMGYYDEVMMSNIATTLRMLNSERKADH